MAESCQSLFNRTGIMGSHENVARQSGSTSLCPKLYLGEKNFLKKKKNLDLSDRETLFQSYTCPLLESHTQSTRWIVCSESFGHLPQWKCRKILDTVFILSLQTR